MRFLKARHHHPLTITSRTLFVDLARFPTKNHRRRQGCPAGECNRKSDSGDSFAGGFLGYLVKKKDFSEANMRRAMVYGSVIASFNVEDFSLSKLIRLKGREIEARVKRYKQLTSF